MLIVISSKNATEWCVTWLVFEYDLKNALFDHSLEIWFATSGLNICWSQNKYFWNQCKKCFNLRCHLDHLSLIFLFNIMTVRIGKCFWSYHVTHQLINKTKSIGRSETQRGVIRAISSWIWVKRAEMVLELRFWTFCQFPDHPIAFCERQTYSATPFNMKLAKISSKLTFVGPILSGVGFAFFE